MDDSDNSAIDLLRNINNLNRLKMEPRYNNEYRQYYFYALEQFLIKTYGYSEHDARIKVMQDYDEIKEDFERKEKT